MNTKRQNNIYMSCQLRQPGKATFHESGQNGLQSWTTLFYDSDKSDHNIMVLLDLNTLQGLSHCVVSRN